MKGSHGMAVASWTFPVTYDHHDFDISILKVCTQVYTHTPNLGDDLPLFCSSSVSDKTFAEQSKSDWETSLSDAGAVVGFGACDFLGDDDDVRCLNVFFFFFKLYRTHWFPLQQEMVQLFTDAERVLWTKRHRISFAAMRFLVCVPHVGRKCLLFRRHLGCIAEYRLLSLDFRIRTQFPSPFPARQNVNRLQEFTRLT